MDKETLEAFLTPFSPEIRVLVRMPDGSLGEFSGVTYGFVNDGEGIVILELPSE
jgi:hypothetical protein